MQVLSKEQTRQVSGGGYYADVWKWQPWAGQYYHITNPTGTMRWNGSTRYYSGATQYQYYGRLWYN